MERTNCQIAEEYRRRIYELEEANRRKAEEENERKRLYELEIANRRKAEE